jgi:1-acyl-sn-glycerol-3-phosphate acyltransferase
MSKGNLREALGDLAGALVPLSALDASREYGERMARIPTRVNEYGFDPYGLEPAFVARTALPAVLLYRHWFRVEVHGIENLPSDRALVVANHAGQLPFDALMLNTALVLEAEPPRIARSMAEYWISRLPFVSTAASRVGAMVGTPRNCVRMLENEECVVVFPEGTRGMNKPWRERYRLQRFGTGFMRLALEARAPIVPVGIVGSEEQQFGLANLERLAHVLHMPALPVTATFPLLGPLGLLPLPVKYHIHFGDPMDFEGAANEDDAAIELRVERVKGAIDALLDRGRAERTGVFR